MLAVRSGPVAFRLISVILPVTTVAIGLVAAPTAAAQQGPTAADVDAVFSAYASPRSPGCVVGVVQAGELILARGYGMADLEQGRPLSAGSVMSVGSMAKQFTAASIALLAADGVLSLDDDVRRFLPELPDYGSTITVRHLLHHTSGIRNYYYLMGLASIPFEDVQTDDDRLSLIARQRAINFEPGTEHEYTNSGYFLLSKIVERATGRSLREYAEERIFRPLGMTDTHFHDDRRMLVPNRATSYGPAPDGFDRAEYYNWEGVGDVGLMTTVEDLARWDRNFRDNRLGDGFIDAMLTRGRLESGAELDYALGLYHGMYRGLATVWHGGAFSGFGAQMLRFPEAEFTALVLCNLATANAASLANQVADIYLADRLAEPSPRVAGGPRPAAFPSATGSAPLEPARLAEFVARYYSDELDATMELVLGDAGLMMRRRGEPDQPFSYLGDDAFGVGGGPRGMLLGRSQFRRDAAGRIEGFVFDAYRVSGLWFGRVP